MTANANATAASQSPVRGLGSSAEGRRAAVLDVGEVVSIPCAGFGLVGLTVDLDSVEVFEGVSIPCAGFGLVGPEITDRLARAGYLVSIPCAGFGLVGRAST